MLKAITCEKFHQKTISFKPGLNVVVGDDLATNSIGKSTLLMVVDFIMGGSDFLDHNADVVAELGHHDYRATFEFVGKSYLYRRETAMPDVVQLCDESWGVIEVFTLHEYRDRLTAHYGLTDLGLTLRQACAPFSRIWGKKNLEPARPLDAHLKQSAADPLNLVLKLFQKYDEVEGLEGALKDVKARASALTAAFRENVVPKITKKKYKENSKEISELSEELESIRSDLALYATNLRQLANKEVAEIKSAKDDLLDARARVSSRLQRVTNSMKESKHIQSKTFEVLKKFFPSMESERLASVEEFHSDIAKILRKEIRQSERTLKEELDRIDEALLGLDGRLREILANVENPALIVDRVYDVSKKVRSLQQENEYHDQDVALRSDAGILKKDLEERRLLALSKISKLINEELSSLAKAIYQNSQKSPYLYFSSSNYDYKIYEDTGTGKAYGNLILFDLAVFRTTRLPYLIHDSLLFKNVENKAVERIVEQYGHFKRQSFIALDEVGKYSEATGELVDGAAVVRLSDDRVLYIKDWRRRDEL